MWRDVGRYISSCQSCQTNKVDKRAPVGLLQPHKITERCWQVVTADFLSELPLTPRQHDVILVIIDKLSKRAIFAASSKRATAETVFQLFQDRLFTQHGVPELIISDRDPLFSSNYWRDSMHNISVKLDMSTASHPQTDGQSERAIQMLLDMLRPVVQQYPNDWDKLLSTIEYEYNSTRSTAHHCVPFEVDLGLVPAGPLTSATDRLTYRCQPAADAVSHRADDPKPGLPSKGRPRFLGPFRIIRKMSPVVYQIELPPAMKRAHNIVHSSKLKRYYRPANETGPLDIVIDAHGTVEQEVSAILDKKRINRSIHYLTLFEGDPVTEAVWLPEKELDNCSAIVKEFNSSSRRRTSKGKR
eukprot:IDg4604t1